MLKSEGLGYDRNGKIKRVRTVYGIFKATPLLNNGNVKRHVLGVFVHEVYKELREQK